MPAVSHPIPDKIILTSHHALTIPPLAPDTPPHPKKLPATYTEATELLAAVGFLPAQWRGRLSQATLCRMLHAHYDRSSLGPWSYDMVDRAFMAAFGASGGSKRRSAEMIERLPDLR